MLSFFMVIDHNVTHEYERELYLICPQRRCTLQSNGKNKNMSENYLMREQFSQNSRKRKDKRLQNDSRFCELSDIKGEFRRKNSKQTRRVVSVDESQPVKNSPLSQSQLSLSVRRQLKYTTSTEEDGSLADTQAGETPTKKPKLENLKEKFPSGQLIWGKLKGFDWWPGIVVDVGASASLENHINEVWVKWFGDNKFSKLIKNEIVLFRHFQTKFLNSKFRGVYKRAVVEALEVAVSRCKKELNAEDNEKCDRVKLLLDWALDDFKPSGPEPFETIKDEHKVSISPSAVNLEEAWNHHEGKNRFGQPIRKPALAEDVKVVFDQAASGVLNIEDICLGCGDVKISVRHPLFYGALCDECKDTFLECVYLFDEDGYQMYCTICGDGKEVFMCESPACFRSYCAVCLELMCGTGTVEQISSLETWCCIMCQNTKVGLLEKREDWQEQLRQLFDMDKEHEYTPPMVSPPVPPEKRKPLRVLSLFDGIGTGLFALKELGLNVEVYVASEIDENATMVVKVQHGDDDVVKLVGDIEQITPNQIQSWGPFDLVIGASPCNDLSIANPLRQGVYEGSGRLFFEFFRLLMYAKPEKADARPFFWLFENVVSMRTVDKRTISRFLQCNPVVVDAKDISPARRARYFWGNLPGMNRPTIPVSGDKLSLQSCLEPHCGRKARFTKIQTVTTKSNSIKQTREGILPVEVFDSDVNEDLLWSTEMERLFGFPPHYTDVANMGRNQRQKLLGKSWSVPVIKHLFSPLREYFSSKSVAEDCNQSKS
ncbi:DNA (cytosine-5)-methyltransferase 3A-like isoform X2 [Xenia sp. Carnegie-2017]|uniref:DNA (cytosine-5)-methyltransferase 3A-like isoform X2 n=1 Tax=Xenia sp. Carnegie-2017 TaxID=2897299 RepID=UPI001F0471DD|nr:DNA (cytosine-5)-methyltransferase 3A-like isoform X2 [Xenia sp. Carnegie-2017]